MALPQEAADALVAFAAQQRSQRCRRTQALTRKRAQRRPRQRARLQAARARASYLELASTWAADCARAARTGTLSAARQRDLRVVGCWLRACRPRARGGAAEAGHARRARGRRTRALMRAAAPAHAARARRVGRRCGSSPPAPPQGTGHSRLRGGRWQRGAGSRCRGRRAQGLPPGAAAREGRGRQLRRGASRRGGGCSRRLGPPVRRGLRASGGGGPRCQLALLL